MTTSAYTLTGLEFPPPPRTLPDIFWSFAAFLLLLTFLQCHGMARLKATGVDTAGVITAVETSMASRGGGRRYDVGYVFVPRTQASRSRSYTGIAFVSAATFYSTVAGDTVVVTYDPHSPGTSRLRSELDTTWAEPYSKLRELAKLLLPLVGIAPALAIGHARWAFLQEERLVRWGSVAPAVIVAERQIRRNRQNCTCLTYQFRDDGGRVVTGKRSDLRSRKGLDAGYGALARSTAADYPLVLYDPANSSHNLLFPPVMMRLVR